MLRDYPYNRGGLAWQEYKHWARAGHRPEPQHLRDHGVHLMSAGPTGNLSLPPMPAAMPAAEVYQATAAVITPR